MRYRKNWLLLMPVFIWSAVIAWSSSTAAVVQQIPEIFPGVDKLHHVLVYGLWGALAAMSVLAWQPRLSCLAMLLIVGVAGTLFGALDELHQSFVPGRHADVLDLAADVLGTLAGAYVYWKLIGGWKLLFKFHRGRAAGPAQDALPLAGSAETSSNRQVDCEPGEGPHATVATQQVTERSAT